MELERHFSVMEEIERVAEEAIDKAKAKEDRNEVFPGAINWADLHCTDVELTFSLSERQYRKRLDAEGKQHNLRDYLYRVTVEEASETNGELRAFVAEYIKERLGIVAEVVTEW